MGCCQALTGITRDCENNVGGIRRAWGACFDDVTQPTPVGEQITTIPEPSAWKLYEFRKQTGSVTTTITNDDANGTSFYESAIVLQFAKQETSKRIEIMAIASGDTAWIIEDNNGLFWYFGYDFPVTISDGGTAETGTALADFNGYNITLDDMGRQLPFEVTKSAMEPILNPASGS